MFMVRTEYPPLTTAEIEDIAERVRDGERLTREEMDRLQSQGAIIQGELLITAYRGSVSIKRYGGLDLAEL